MSKKKLLEYCESGIHIYMSDGRCRDCKASQPVLVKNIEGKWEEFIPISDGGAPVDPKQSQAIKKMCFEAVPISLLLHAYPGNQNGADKYGIYNWLKLEDGSMSLNTYLNALQRHLLLFRAGQDYTSDTNTHNLDSMISGLAVVRDAMLFNKVKDDRVKLSPEQIIILEKLLNKET